MADDDIDTSDISTLGAEFFETADLIMPKGRSSVLVTVDEDVLDWYEEQSKDNPHLISDVLREYAETHR